VHSFNGGPNPAKRIHIYQGDPIYEAQDVSSHPRPDGGFMGTNLSPECFGRSPTKRGSGESQSRMLRQDGLGRLERCNDVLASRGAFEKRQSLVLRRQASEILLRRQRWAIMHEGCQECGVVLQRLQQRQGSVGLLWQGLQRRLLLEEN
jgi:hypothetical protein